MLLVRLLSQGVLLKIRVVTSTIVHYIESILLIVISFVLIQKNFQTLLLVYKRCN